MTTKKTQQNIQAGIQAGLANNQTPFSSLSQQDVHGQSVDSGANLAKVSVQDYLASHPSDPNQRDVTTGYQGFKGGRPLTPAEQLALRKAVAARAQQQLSQPNQQAQPQGQPLPPDVQGQQIQSGIQDGLKAAINTVTKKKGKP